MPKRDRQDIFDLMRRAVYAGGAELKRFWQVELQIINKSDDSPVTEADHASNTAIIKILSEMPEVAILSEETEDNDERLLAKEVFVIDPLDGTNNYIKGVDEFAVLIGYLEDNKPVIGLVYNPVTDVLYYAIEGGGAYREDVSGVSRISVNKIDQFVDMTAVVSRVHDKSRTMRFLTELGVNNIIPMGGGGLKMCQVAEGVANIYVNPTNKLGEWDAVSSFVIVREAGGTFTDVYGDDPIFNKPIPNMPNGILVSNGKRHQEMVDLIKDKYL